MAHKIVYIFLDIDGVLNDETYFWKCFHRHKVKEIMSMDNFPFNPDSLNNLMILVQTLQRKQFQPKVILSSTWRIGDIPTAIVQSRLAEYGIRLQGKTSNLGYRGQEIKEFLHDKEYFDYIILDDESFDFKEEKIDNHLIKTNYNTGFNQDILNKALEYINNFEKE